MNSSPVTETLMGHLLELRARLLKGVLALAVIFFGLVGFANPLYSWLAAPLLQRLPAGAQLIAIDVTSAFFAPVKLVFFIALLAAMPVLLYQAWAFVAPGLYQHERKLARPLLLISVALFYLGNAFAYYVLLPAMFSFLIGSAPEGVTMMTDVGRYLDFVLVMFLAAGLSFEVPIAVLIAALLGWVTPAQLSEWRGYVIVGIFIIAAIITPPDGLSQILLAVPMCALYEIGIIAARLLARPRHAVASD